jgi:hypothetical protein
MRSLRHLINILFNRINNIIKLNADMSQSKVLINLLLRRLLEEEKKIDPPYFSKESHDFVQNVHGE